MKSRRLPAVASWTTLVVAVAAACSSTPANNIKPYMSSGSASGSGGSGAGATGGSGSTGVGSGSTPVTSGAGTTSGSGAATGSASGVVTGGSGAATGATSGTTASGAGTGTTSGSSGTASGSAGASSGSGGTALPAMNPSAGCGKAWTGAINKWVSQPAGCTQGNNNQGTAACQVIPPGGTVPATAIEGSPENRGWWVYVPTNYDPSKAYKVIYNGAGCDDPNWFNAGEDGFPYYMTDDDQAILVGLDYDTFSSSPGCYDNRTKTSNDFTFFPWLMNEIESTFCVDTNHEYYSGYSSGGWVAQQLNCAFPDKLRGELAVTGCEPGGAADPYNTKGQDSQPTCVSKPTAMLYMKDIDDTDNSYACMIPGCARVLAQNGCTNTKCDPTDTTITTPYPAAAVAGVNLQISQGTCVKFNGCPAEYPVVWCTTNYPPNHHDDDQYMGVVPLFWDFITNKLN
jgi:hypothetical protein